MRSKNFFSLFLALTPVLAAQAERVFDCKGYSEDGVEIQVLSVFTDQGAQKFPVLMHLIYGDFEQAIEFRGGSSYYGGGEAFTFSGEKSTHRHERVNLRWMGPDQDLNFIEVGTRIHGRVWSGQTHNLECYSN